MKKIICYLLCIILSCGVCACGNINEEVIKPDDNTFLVNFLNYCEEDVYEILFEYYLNDTSIGGGGVENADGSAFIEGDILTREFINKDFPESADTKDFGMEIFVVDQYGKEYPCSSKISFEAEYGEVYDILLTGDSQRGFFLQLIE